jgi:hypothetical protein
MWWSFGFDGQPRDLDYVMQHGTGFEPWFWYFAPDDKGVEEGAGTKAPAGPGRAELQAMKFREVLELAQDPVCFKPRLLRDLLCLLWFDKSPLLRRM